MVPQHYCHNDNGDVLHFLAGIQRAVVWRVVVLFDVTAKYSVPEILPACVFDRPSPAVAFVVPTVALFVCAEYFPVSKVNFLCLLIQQRLVHVIYKNVESMSLCKLSSPTGHRPRF